MNNSTGSSEHMLLMIWIVLVLGGLGIGSGVFWVWQSALQEGYQQGFAARQLICQRAEAAAAEDRKVLQELMGDQGAGRSHKPLPRP